MKKSLKNKSNHKVHYFYRAILCILIFALAMLSAHTVLHQSIDSIITILTPLEDNMHVVLLFVMPIYLALVIFGFGITSVYFMTKIDQFFE